LLQRDPKWGKVGPTPAQLGLCKKLRIAVPAGATKGEVAAKLTEFFLRRKQRRAA